jgi:arylsulfatase A-like enzyme
MKRFLIACCLTALSCASAPEPAPAAKPLSRPNILLVTIDTVRADHTSVHGYAKATTPFLVELAAQGVRFDRAYATSSWTVPTIASILTSLEPAEHGVTSGFVERGRSVDQQVLAHEHLRLPEVLRDAGYTTVGVTANAHLGANFGFDQGFDRYANVGFTTGTRLKHEIRALAGKLMRAEPWFLWVHYFDPHGPYTERDGTQAFLADEPDLDRELYDRLQTTIRERDDVLALGLQPGDRAQRYLTALYDGEIRYVDDQIRTLVRDLGLGQDDMIVVTADHGEEFLDHGDWWHGHTLYEEAVRVPLVLRLPGNARAGTVVDHPVSLTQVMPTILRVARAGGDDPASGLFQSSEPVRASLSLFGNLEMIVEGPFKYIRNLDSGDQALYDLVADPAERVNLMETRPGVAADMGLRLDTSILEQAAFAAGAATLSEEQAAQLRSLGYVN